MCLTRFANAAGWLLGAAIFGYPQIAAGSEVIVVCPTGFQSEMTRWVDYRRAEGFSVHLIDSHRDARELKQSVSRAATDQTRYVVLVGDAPSMGTMCNPLRQVPIHYHSTTVSARYGSTPTLSSDLQYGDFDDNGQPDAVVGRLPVDTPDQLTRLVERIIAHESSRDFGAWRSRVDLIGGVGGFGPLIDGTIETATRTIVTGMLPGETRTTVAFASPGHRFCPQQPFNDAVIQRYQQGARFWVYAGHGQITELDRVPARTGVPILDCQSVARLNRPQGASPIALLLACYSGAVDGPDDSVAEEMIRCQGGPIAVLAGSRVTMPYGNATAAVAMIKAIYQQRAPRLGAAWLCALHELHDAEAQDQSSTRVMIDAMATIFSPKGTRLVDERREHMMLYNLIGDPTLRLHHPQAIEVSVPSGHAAGETLEISTLSPIAGEITVSLDRPIGAGTGGDPNDTTVASLVTEVGSGQRHSHQFKIPEDVSGPIVVRAQVAGESTWAAGSARTIVQ